MPPVLLTVQLSEKLSATLVLSAVPSDSLFLMNGAVGAMIGMGKFLLWDSRMPGSDSAKAIGPFLLACLLSVVMGVRSTETAAQDGAVADDPPVQQVEIGPLGAFVTVGSPIDDSQFARVKKAALGLQNDAVRQNRRAVLVLEFTPGSSEFHQVYGLAEFLSSADISKVTTVAWIPETVTGHNAIPALACNEIVMHPDAELGDIGRGEAVDPGRQEAVLRIIRRRGNLKVSPDLVKGMMDPQQTIIKLELGPEPGKITETRVVTQAEAQRLRANKEPILNDTVIWEAGTPGRLSGSVARRLDILVVGTATERLDLLETYNLPREAMRETPALAGDVKARLIRVDGMIEPTLEAFIVRQIDRAVAGGANLLIFEIDSPGGFLLPSENLAFYIADLDPKKVHTVAYIPGPGEATYKGAYSGAAFIALGCDEIYMHPDAQIGDAGPIEAREGGAFERADEKVLSPLRDKLRQLAIKKGRPPALTEAMADKDLLVYEVTHKKTGRVWYMSDHELQQEGNEWIKGPVVPESRQNNLLTVNGRRAHELKIAGPPVENLEELKQDLGLDPELKLVRVERTWVDTLVFLLNTRVATFLLLVLGVACIYLELHLMTGFLGILSALCFGVFFWSKFLGGTAGWLEVVFFALGLACIAMEIFVIPGFGVFGVSGALLVLVSLVMASQTFGNLEPNRDLQQLSRNLLMLGASVATVIGMAAVLSRYLPQIPLLNQMVLHPPGAAPEEEQDEPRLKPELQEEREGLLSLVGSRGEALSDLRPAGKAEIDGRFLHVVSDGPYIARGTAIEVVSVAGNRIVVREA